MRELRYLGMLKFGDDLEASRLALVAGEREQLWARKHFDLATMMMTDADAAMLGVIILSAAITVPSGQ
jgi:hypothetical protein